MANAEAIDSAREISAGCEVEAGGEGRLDRETRQRPSLPSFVTAFLLALIVLAYKAPDSLTSPQFWAEDGAVFFAQQRGHWLPLLVKPYASYLHVIPRTVAWVALAFPLAYTPALYCYSAWLLGAGALASLRALRFAGLPLVVVLSAIALTPTNGEAFGTLTNVHWILQFYLLSVLARMVTETEDSSWFHSACTLLVGMSGPFSIFAWGAAVGLATLTRIRWLQAWAHVTPLRWTRELTSLTVAALTQLSCIALSDDPAAVSHEPVSWAGALRVISYVQLHAFTTDLISSTAFYFLLAVLGMAALWLAADVQSRLMLLGVYAFATLQLLAVIAKFSGEMSRALGSMENGDRYFVMPKAVLFWMLAIVLAKLAEPRAYLRAGFLAALAAGPALFYQDKVQRPPFRDLHWREQASRVAAGEAIDIEIHPPGWKVHVEP